MGKRTWLAALFGVLTLALAAGQTSGVRCGGELSTPTPTDVVHCTPPPCDRDAGEIYYCPDTCPGGCGTECATVTPVPTATPTVFVFCTPPPCDRDAGEVYHCSDKCPGGCGTECATATPEPSAP